MAKRDKRQKAQDVFNESTPFLGTVDSFGKAYPTVAELTVTVTEEGDDLWHGSRTSTYGKRSASEYINCSNPRCFNGGFHLGTILHRMTYDRETEWQGSEFCQGYEGSPKGRKNYGPCDHRFKIDIQITYGDEASAD